MTVVDIAIIGGGVNGCGIARDAVGRGWSVALFEKGDLASGTSSASTKLIHGGLRYLEHYAFGLVRHALMEREVIWEIAPHIVWPLRFVLPHHAGLRPRWLLRLGLFLYDHLGGRVLLPPTSTLDLQHDPAGAALKPWMRHAFEYSDCWVEDSRLVVLNAMDAAERGALIFPRTRVLAAARGEGLWHISVRDEASGATDELSARALINAAGPWVGDVLGGVIHENAPARVRLVQGSHIVVPRIAMHDKAYIFQNADGRIIFAIPYETDFTLIGTTDRDYRGDPAEVTASPDEIAYLCAAASDYFRAPVTPDDVVWTYSGVRPLYDDGASAAQEATRDYKLVLERPSGEAPLLSIFGGKITTYRRLAEEALHKLTPLLPKVEGFLPGWTALAGLPGGDFPHDGFEFLVATLQVDRPWLDDALARRLARAYGTRAERILEGARSKADLGRDMGAGLTAREVAYLMAHEWARNAEDVLWRRSKLGLRVNPAQVAALDELMRGAQADLRSHG
jgi:glycerol-3-phosphate dehydrogenase